MVGLFVGTTRLVLYIAIALAGYGNSNVFSLVFAQALQSAPEKQNEVSGLMVTASSEVQSSPSSWDLPVTLWVRLEPYW